MSDQGDDTDPTPPAGIDLPSLVSALKGPSELEELDGLAQIVELLPGWSLLDEGSTLLRDYDFETVAQALLCLHYVATLASGSGWWADLELRRQGVRVKVSAPSGQRVRALEVDAAAVVHSAVRRLWGGTAHGDILLGASRPEPSS